MLLKFYIANLLLLTLRTSNSVQATDLTPTPPEAPEYRRICPLPKCGRCPSVEELQAPGVGFALEIDHGTAAVRLHDGTFRDIAIIGGDASYTALMRRLATGPENRMPDHFDTNWEIFLYLKTRAQRLFNRLMGRPATPDIAILASMVSKLIKATESYPGLEQRTVAAVLSSPDRIRLSYEELNDIFEYLKLQNLMQNTPLSPSELYASSAAYVGYGKGVCRNYIDENACEREEQRLPTRRVLHLDYGFESLSGTLRTLQRATDGIASESFIDLDLGSGRALADSHGTESEQYWTAVTNRIRTLAKSVQRYVYLPHVGELLLTGSSAGNRRFQAAVREALHDLVADEDVLSLVEAAGNTSDNWQSVFNFATARGAAEFAKRRQEGPTSCAQSEECRRLRERVHNEGGPLLLEQKADL